MVHRKQVEENMILYYHFPLEKSNFSRIQLSSYKISVGKNVAIHGVHSYFEPIYYYFSRLSTKTGFGKILHNIMRCERTAILL